MIVAWPTADQAVVIAIGPHDRRNDDVYGMLLGTLDRDVPAEERDKPPCCDDEGLPPVDPESTTELADALERVEQVRSPGRRRSSHPSAAQHLRGGPVGGQERLEWSVAR